MKIKLTSGLTEDEAKEVKEEFIRSLRFRKHLIKVLEKEIESLRFSMRNNENFESPSWPYIQASLLGQEKALLTLINIIKSEEI